MVRLKLPRANGPQPWSELPPLTQHVSLLVNRREFLKALALLGTALAVPLTRPRQAWARSRGRFFTAKERATLTAYANRIIPRDHDPGAKDLGVPRYIEGLLTAFDARVPRLYAGGPFSNRNVFPDNQNGTPSRKRPRDDFRHFVPPTRLQKLRWQVELFGLAGVQASSTVTPADADALARLDAASGTLPTKGLRDVYREGLAMVGTLAVRTYGKTFTKLSAAQQDDVFKKMEGFTPDPRRDTFNSVVISHTLEGCFGAPEYGGNANTRGWKMLGLEGDSQPLGYSIFDRSSNVYRERPDHPMTTANPDEVAGATPLTSDGQRVQTSIVALTAFAASGDC
jgi:hypothetical protein